MSTMSPEARAARSAYMKVWRQRNRDKTRAYNERYWEKKADSGRQFTPESARK